MWDHAATNPEYAKTYLVDAFVVFALKISEQVFPVSEQSRINKLARTEDTLKETFKTYLKNGKQLGGDMIKASEMTGEAIGKVTEKSISVIKNEAQKIRDWLKK